MISLRDQPGSHRVTRSERSMTNRKEVMPMPDLSDLRVTAEGTYL